jgi:predicted PolB exonuclease-like 3'-5' exonuclease
MGDQPRGPGSILAYDIETVSTAEMPDGSFPPWPTHLPIAIGFARADLRDGNWIFDLEALVVGEIDEDKLLREADKRMAAAEAITSFNGRQFDALVLRLAAQRRRLFGLRALADHAAAHRFGGEHVDLADLYASYGRKVSLASICDEVGIPVKTTTHGSDVAALWQAGSSAQIRDYVLEDAVATLCLWFAWSAARHADEALITRPLAALARHIEATPALHHLQPFVDCDLMRWARPKALLADIAAAFARSQRKIERQEEERAFVP